MKYSNRIRFEGLHKKVYIRILRSMTGAERDKARTKLNNDQKQLKQNWEGYHLLEFAKTIRPTKGDTKSRNELDGILESNGIGGFQALQKLPSGNSAFTTEKSECVFESIAAFQDIPTFVCFINFLEFCRDSEPSRPLNIFDGDDKLSISVDGKCEAVTLDYAIDDFKKHAKTVEKKLKCESSQDNVEHTDSIQPQLTIPQADKENINYYASMAIKEAIGRDKQKERLESFLECDKNVAWFQLAGEAGQGKSRLAFDLMNKASELGWRAGFVEEDDIEFFKDHWKDWQPDKPHLLIFDYVIGCEEEIKHIFNALLPKPPDQRKYQHNIRILLLERQRWDRGEPIKATEQKNDNESNISPHNADKAQWFLNLCKKNDFKGKSLEPSRFDDGIEELKELGSDELVTIVKQIFSGKELTISDDELKKTLERIDDSGRPLYAYLLAQQLSDSQEGYQSWTKIELLNFQLKRDRERWQYAFKDEAPPVCGDHHPAMKLAVLATIVKEVKFQEEHVKQYFGDIDSPFGKKAVSITSGYLIHNNKRPHKIYALKPDLLGEWFVLYCFDEGLGFEELLDFAWQYWPKETATFLQRITQDFIVLPKEYNNSDLTEKLVAHKPSHENHYHALANVAVSIVCRFDQRNLTIPHNIFTSLERAVNLSDVDAMVSLGMIYHEGVGIARNPEKAVELYRQAADLDNSQAMVKLGLCFEKGEGVEQDWSEAIRLYRQAEKLGNSNAMINLGLCFERGKGVEQDWSEAIRLYQQAADLGNSNAMINLGLCFENGEGIEQDWSEAIRLYRQAIELGNSHALVNLGYCFEEGKGVEQDWSEAIRLYRQAEKLGNSQAMFNLGFCFERGKGVEQDWSEAIRLYQQAVELGNRYAMVFLGTCFEEGKGVEQDWTEAVHLYQQAVELGNSHAMVYLGICFEAGKGVEQDWTEAVHLYQQAVELGNSKAMANLGLCFEKGKGVEQDWNEAIRLYRQAADLGNSNAMINLGFCFERGKGVEQDWSEAIRLYRQAVVLGNSQAMVNLGFCYQNGTGIEQNWDKAIKLYLGAVIVKERRAIDALQNILLLQIFLNKGSYKNQNIKAWPNIKRSRLTTAPEFDPPVMVGAWKKLTTKEVTAHLNKAMASLDILDLIQKLDGYYGQYGRFTPLNFYRDCSLADIQLYNPSNKNTLIFSVIFNTKSTILLNGGTQIIHGFNPFLLTFNKKQSSLNYLQFFCSYCPGENGPFQIISHLDEIPFNGLETSQHRQGIEKSFFTPRYIEGCFENEGWQKFEACVLYTNSLFSVAFKVFSDGMIDLENDSPIANELPIFQRQYNGVLRSPLQSI